MAEMKCVSCHINLITEDDFVKFKCPSCGDKEIMRCFRCRKKSTPYTCQCEFEGP